MWCFAIISSFLFISAKASGEFSVLYSPPSLDFKGNENLDTESLVDVFSASLGYPVQESSNWPGLYVNDPFSVPKGVVAVVVDGAGYTHLKSKAKKTYTLVGDSTQESFNILSTMLEEFDSSVVDVDLSQGVSGLQTYSDVFGDDISIPTSATSSKLSTDNLKPNLHSGDKIFLEEIELIRKLSNRIGATSSNKLPTLITIRLSLEPVENAHGEKSAAYAEALKLVSDAIENFAIAARKAYEGDLLFAIVTVNPEHYRAKRQAVKEEIDPSKLNLATHYSDDYPVIFNIILWFGVVMAFSLLAISYTIATMDPGRDSIIYRMTSTRMKKDN